MEKTSVVQRKRFLKRRAQRTMRRVLPFLASLFLATPLASPVSKSLASGHALEMPGRPAAALPKAEPTQAMLFSLRLQEAYQALGAEQQGLRFEVFEKAMTGYLNLQQQGKLSADKQLLTVIDFDLPSTAKRLWVLDLASNQVVF